MVTPFQIPFDAAMVENLQRRLDNTRWADAVTEDWSMGTERRFLEQFVRYWRDHYDWAARVKLLNKLPHYHAAIDGHGMHFLHYRSGVPESIPLLLMNGWPSSFAEYQRLAPLLTSGSPAFDVVIPTMPGFGFSDRPTKPYELEPVHLFSKLMTLLGYDQFVAAGTDIGSGTATRIALQHPDRVLAAHISAVAPKPRASGNEPRTAEELAYDVRLARWQRDEGGYQAIQSSRPQTLAFALADSPVGLASWILEKYRTWSDCDGDVLSVWPRETLIDTIMIYWMTNTIGSSIRYYYEAARLRPALKAEDFVRAPTGVAMWPCDLALAPRELAERLYNVQRYTVMPKGGHFPAWEAPELYAEELRLLSRRA
ncbi:epoxide hydrolase family protein [Sphingopyxis sp.]|uniref:epoxide hydrolase family protein n=1 Tax=Sphingopyxis sp. TaxID=1908224 RepID=UPI002FCA729D